MNTIKNIFLFLQNGINVFSAASRGRYTDTSSDVKALREQLLKNSSPMDDRVNLNNDLHRVYGDLHVSFRKLALNHG